MEQQLSDYFKDYGLKVDQVVFPDIKCRFCGRNLEFVDYDRAQDAVWIACPACVAADDNMHDYYSIPFTEAGVDLDDVH